MKGVIYLVCTGDQNERFGGDGHDVWSGRLGAQLMNLARISKSSRDRNVKD